MKSSSIFLALVAAAAGGMAQAQQEFIPDAPAPSAKQDGVKYTLLKPSDKTSEVVKAEERNPFARIDVDKDPNQKTVNEENQIRDRLEKLRVVGVSPGKNGLRVMLGDIILEAGQQVPPLLPEQTVALKVGSITAQAIELLWLEARPAGMPLRKLTIPVDLRPYVRYQLKGIATDKNQWEKKESKDDAKDAEGRAYPDVSDAAHMAALKEAQNRMANEPPPAPPAPGQTSLAELPTEASNANPLLPPPTMETSVKPGARK
jgi:hypothetical protein